MAEEPPQGALERLAAPTQRASPTRTAVRKPASGGFERPDQVLLAHRLHAGQAASQMPPTIPGITSHSSGLLIHDDSSAR